MCQSLLTMVLKSSLKFLLIFYIYDIVFLFFFFSVSIVLIKASE